jgi:hypothetical protein
VANTARGQKRKRGKSLKFFYLNGDLHMRLHVDRGSDVLTAWNFTQHKRVGYSYFYVRQRAEKAYRTPEVAAMLNRGPQTLELAILRGDIRAPQKNYSIRTGKTWGYFWSDEDIMDARDYLATVHRGRPRKDGLISPQALPTKRELRAMLQQEVILYAKTDDGEFVPSWKARDI